MIRLLLEPVNLLILDEPTNHLDMQSKDVLKEAIKAFDGTAIIVSHDREFLDGLVTKVYEFGEGRVREHLGGIYDFLRTRNVGSLDALGQQSAGKAAEQARPEQAAKAQEPARQDYAERKEAQKRIRKAEKAVQESEASIGRMEARLKELDGILCQPENASDMELITEYTSIKKELDAEVERWERLSEELEAIAAG